MFKTNAFVRFSVGLTVAIVVPLFLIICTRIIYDITPVHCKHVNLYCSALTSFLFHENYGTGRTHKLMCVKIRIKIS